MLLISFPLAPSTAVALRVSWPSKGTFPSLNTFLSGTTAWEDEEQPVKVFIAGWAAVATVWSIVLLIVAWTWRTETWVNWLSGSILLSKELRFSRSWTCCCYCWNCCWSLVFRVKVKSQSFLVPQQEVLQFLWFCFQLWQCTRLWLEGHGWVPWTLFWILEVLFPVFVFVVFVNDVCVGTGIWLNCGFYSIYEDRAGLLNALTRFVYL